MHWSNIVQKQSSQTLFEGNKRKDKKEGKTWEKREHLLDDSKETICWKMKKDALDRNTQKTRYERSYGRVARKIN